MIAQMKQPWQDLVFNPIVRILLPLVCFVLLSAMTLMYIFHRPVVYESSARVWVQVKAPPATSSAQSAVYSPLSAFFNSPLATATEVMKSAIVANAAVENLKERLPAKECPSADAILGGLSVEPVKEADVLQVSFKNANPRITAEVVTAVLDGFVKVNSTQSAGSAVQSRVFLEKQLSFAQSEYQKARKRLKDFQEASHTVNFEQQTGTLLLQAAQITTDLRQAKVEQAQAKAKIAALSEQLGMSEEKAALIDKLAQDPVIQALKEKQADLQVKLVEAKSKSEESPRVTRIKASIRKTESALQDRITQQLGFPDPSITADRLPGGKDKKRQTILDDIAKEKRDILAIDEKIASLSSVLSSSNNHMSNVPRDQVQFADLTRAEKVTSDALSEAERNLAAAQLTESVAQESSNIQIIDRPRVPMAPESAGGKKIFLVAEALIFVLCVAIYLTMRQLDPHVYSGRQVAKLLSLPMAGWVEPYESTGRIEDIPILHRLRLTLNGWIKSGPQALVVLSPNRNDGKTTVAAGLALSYAESGARVLIIDVDFVSPSLHKIFNIPNSSGIADYVNHPDDQFLARSAKLVAPNLLLVPAGNLKSTNTLLEGAKLHSLLNQAASCADLIIFDSAAVAESESALALLSVVHKILAVAQLGHTRIAGLKLLARHVSEHEYDAAAVITNAHQGDFVASQEVYGKAQAANEFAPAW